MKKRIISMLLTVLMVMSLFSGLPLSAYAATTAGANTIEYTMAAGDYVLRICQKFGLNYYTCKDAIMILNNIYDGQWNKLAVGRTLILPASDNDAILIANGAKLTNVNSGANATTLSTGTAATYTTGTATTGTSVATTTTFKSADGLAYYLVPYTMSVGENVSGVCNSLGVNFNIFSPFIKQVNGISDWSKVRAGQTLIIPTPVCPSVGTTCYGVMQHKVTGSDTAYGIATSNGVNYNANKTLLEVLNQTNNLASLTAGQWFYYPVPLTVSVPGTGNPGSTATTTTTTTTTDGNGTTTTTTTTTAKLYKLTSGMSASDGTMLFYVNNQAVTAAPAGAKVTIVTDAKSGKAIQSLTVKQSDGKADLHLTADTFIMPSCDVRVDTEIKSGHDINISANYSGKASASVNNVTVQAAVKGAPVVIKSNDPNYEISAVYANYSKQISSSTKTALTVSGSNAFIMPDANVDVEVILKPVATYAFYVNDPANGSFYLQVNGNSVTRAAKGATVTVVAKPDTGFEPVSLTVRKHGDLSKTVNVFSNTFTMPAFDVDVDVLFAGKGNNILIMPAQIATVLAFDEDTYKKMGTAYLDDAITDANSGEKVYLIAGELQGDVLNDIDEAKYNIKYEIKRNSDGLLVKADPASGPLKNAYVFTMPKGGVTVTPVITARTPATVSGEIYMNGESTPISEYRDCSFSVTYKDGTKEKRTEFKGQGDKLVDIPVLEYVDLRYETSSGVAFVRYKVEVDGDFSGSDLTKDQWCELLTNQANNGAYFQIPDGTTNVTIKAFFENGKVPMGPAVLEGIGSVSYKVSKDDGKTWKSANACEPNDLVLLVVTAGNGYKFDDDKYESRLFVTRKDNGALIKLYQAGEGIMPTPPNLNTYGYTFRMPAEGVDVRAIFDPKPFVITMKCVDEAGKDLTGLGLWQIAIDWVPGVVDNLTSLWNDSHWLDFNTKFDVAYGEYVTVAMTEAGWSKYDMVSFRIDDLEYTADQLNYFYNFQMIDDRAKDLTITAVLRPKNVGIHTMSAIYDTTKIGVEFLILKSPTGYSDEYRFNSSHALNYLNKAVTGDKIAIVANSIDSKYRVEAKDITITAFGTDADRIVPTETWIDAYGNEPPVFDPIRVFTFTMPDADVYVQVNVSGTKYGMTISVYDKTNNNPLNGMVRLFATTATGATISRDVGANNSFDDIPYKSVVQILRSELALAEGKVIKDVEIKTLSGKSINYTDMTSAGEGIYFTMPDEPVWVVIRIDDQHYNIPTVVVTTQVKNGTLVYRKSMNETDPIVDLEDFKPGEIVYVFDVPDEGYAHLGLGDLKIYVNGMNNAVNVQKITTVPHVWSFTMPEGTIIMKADFPEEEAQEVAVNYTIKKKDGSVFNGAEVDVTIGEYTSTLKSSTGTFNVTEGQIMTFASATDGYGIYRLVSAKGLTSGEKYKAPEDAESDTLEITLGEYSNAIKTNVIGGYLEFLDASSNNIASAEIGDTVKIIAHAYDGYDATLPTLNLKITRLTDSTEIKPTEISTNTWTFPMPAGGVMVAASFSKNAKAYVTMGADQKVKITSSLGVGYLEAGSPKTFELSVGDTITVESATEGYDTVKLTATTTGKGVVGNTYTVPSEAVSANENLLINVTSSKSPITWSATGGTLNFTNITKSINHVVSADPDDQIAITASKEAGYLDLEDADLVVTKISDGYPVDDLSGSYPTWTFTMPAGGVNVTATFRMNNLVNVTFNPSKATKLTIDGLGNTTINTSIKYPLTVGMVVMIESAEPGYGEVEVTAGSFSGTKSGAYVSYTVPAADDNVSINHVSTATALQWSATNGTPKFRKANDSKEPAYDASVFKAGDTVWIFADPNSGYDLDQMKIFDADNNDITSTSAVTKGTDGYSKDFWTLTLPDTGINVKPTFKTKTYNLSLDLTSGGIATVRIGGTEIEVQNSSPLAVNYGDSISITPKTGFTWNTAPTVAPSDLSISSIGSMTINKDIGPSGTTIAVTADLKAS